MISKSISTERQTLFKTPFHYLERLELMKDSLHYSAGGTRPPQGSCGPGSASLLANVITFLQAEGPRAVRGGKPCYPDFGGRKLPRKLP